MKKEKQTYHHGNLAESLLLAVDEIATRFGLEAVTLRGCAKLVGVSPSSAFRHYTDKRALLTAFATHALDQLSQTLDRAAIKARKTDSDAFMSVGTAYIKFALDKPAFFRAMWREDTIYSSDENYVAASDKLRGHLTGGFADTLEDLDPESFSPQELLAWSSVHGLASLLVDGPVAKNDSKASKLKMAERMITALAPALPGKPN